MVVFEFCDDKNLPEGVDKCASKEDRDEWVTLRYIVTIENEKRFIQHKFDDERIVKSAETKWYALNIENRSDYVRYITRTKMDLNDDYWGIESENSVGFFTESKTMRSLPYVNNF